MVKIPESKVAPHESMLLETERQHHDTHFTPFNHDALHCRFCTNEARILQAIAIQNGIMQRLLTKFQEAEGTPHGKPFNYSVSSPVQSTVYKSQQVPYPGVIRSLMIAGNGNVTLQMLDGHNAISGGLTICTLPCNGAAVSVPHRFTVPEDAVFTLLTDSSSGTGMLSLSAWIEPVSMSNEEFFRIRK